MKKAETNRFNELYQRHLRTLKLQGKNQKTIEAYALAVRRISECFDCCPDKVTLEQREQYFADLVKSHSWSTVKIAQLGLQFFWKHVLKQDWQRLLHLVQLVLQVLIQAASRRRRPICKCPLCQAPMRILDIGLPAWASG
jgi:hypothetical protein